VDFTILWSYVIKGVMQLHLVLRPHLGADLLFTGKDFLVIDLLND
jgi:hypothetical protein